MIDTFWLLFSAMLVFLMQAGFLCLESGRTRSKNSINVAAKNVIDILVAIAVFWSVGFGVMFGISYQGGIGTNFFLIDGTQTPFQISFFIFQAMFCGTAATIVSGAIAERMAFRGYILISLMISSILYPVTGHWIWGGIYNGEAQGWLEVRGFIDFAGSTVVHSVGGWVALAAIIIIGPRIDRFKVGHKFPVGNNIPLAALGTVLIWFGWFGFNGGSALGFTDAVPIILLNTCLSAVMGGLACIFIHYVHHRYCDVESSLNGIIAGLVAITASCHAVDGKSAALIGMVAGFISYYGLQLLQRLKLDDALSVIPVHAFAGAWGTLAVALFANLDKLGTGLSRFEQFSIQLTGVITVGFYSFCISYLIMWVINYLYPLRVSIEHEHVGLNISEHGASTELIDLLGDMDAQHKEGLYSQKVKVEPFTEVGQIATKYNEIIDRVASEINNRDVAIKKHQVSESKKGAILLSSMDAIISINAQGYVIEFNPAAERLFGVYKKNILGKCFIDSFVDEKYHTNTSESLKYGFLKAGGLLINRRSNIHLTRISGERFPAEITVTAASEKFIDKKEFILHIRDVEKELLMQKRLHFLAYNDPLTQLSNRTHLMTELTSALNEKMNVNYCVAIFFLDLDDFKTINDTLGHKAGDKLLCEVANRLRSVASLNDVIARWGGDEFIYLMKGSLSIDDVNVKANNILKKMRLPITLNNEACKIPVSIGVSLCTQLDKTADEIIHQADIAMYKAKELGKNNFQLYSDAMGKEAEKLLHVEKDMEQALKNGNIFMVYQPKISHNEHEVIAAEALIRWRKPDGNIRLPNDFIPVIEDKEIIIEVGEYIISHVLNQLNTYRSLGKKLIPIAINIPERHLLSRGFIEYLTKQLEMFDIAPNLLEIEITEGILIKDIEHCIVVLTQLKKLGVTISIDDFGTGYSSLNYLKRLPIDILKIDRSFVSFCDTVKEDKEICKTIITLAKGLNLTTIAEGVETVEQLDTLTDWGCDMFQGYYFYKPLTNSQLEKLLVNNVH